LGIQRAWENVNTVKQGQSFTNQINQNVKTAYESMRKDGGREIGREVGQNLDTTTKSEGNASSICTEESVPVAEKQKSRFSPLNTKTGMDIKTGRNMGGGISTNLPSKKMTRISIPSSVTTATTLKGGTENAPICVGYSEINKYAIQVYEKHYPKHINFGDATTINPKELPDFDLLVGGFPCQAFSVAGKRRGFEDTRGTLFFEIARILKEKRPRYLLLENVKGLLSHDGGKTFQTIIGVLTDIGYHVQWQVLNSKDFGVPQNRERVFIIGYLGGRPGREVFPLIGTDGEDTRIVGQDVAYAIDANYHKGTNTLAKSRRSVVQTISRGRSDADWKETDIAPTVRNGDKADVRAVLTPDRTEKRQNGRRMKESGEPSFTLTGQDRHGVCSGARIRRLTPLECERLQGFPDIEKSSKIRVCLDHQKNPVSVEILNPKLPNVAGSVGNVEKPENASSAKRSSSTKNQQINKPVQPDVLISCGAFGVEILSQGKPLLDARFAKKKNWSHPSMEIEGFVHLSVGLNTILERTISFGREGSLVKEPSLTAQKSGGKLGNLSGKEIMLPAKDASKDLITPNQLLKFTTQEHSQIENIEQMLSTSFYYVTHAIIGCIPKEILRDNSFILQLSTREGWTEYGIDGPVSGTQRYKMCGNAVTVNVIEAIIGKMFLVD